MCIIGTCLCLLPQGDQLLFNRGALLNAGALLLAGSSYDHFVFQVGAVYLILTGVNESNCSGLALLSRTEYALLTGRQQLANPA